jgi:hypothetical protein
LAGTTTSASLITSTTWKLTATAAQWVQLSAANASFVLVTVSSSTQTRAKATS